MIDVSFTTADGNPLGGKVFDFEMKTARDVPNEHRITMDGMRSLADGLSFSVPCKWNTDVSLHSLPPALAPKTSKRRARRQEARHHARFERFIAAARRMASRGFEVSFSETDTATGERVEKTCKARLFNRKARRRYGSFGFTVDGRDL